jgi:hypothetical protein
MAKTKAIAWQVHIQLTDGKWVPVCEEFGFTLPSKVIDEVNNHLDHWYDINPDYMFDSGKK